MEDESFAIDNASMQEDINNAVLNHKFTELQEIEEFIKMYK